MTNTVQSLLTKLLPNAYVSVEERSQVFGVPTSQSRSLPATTRSTTSRVNTLRLSPSRSTFKPLSLSPKSLVAMVDNTSTASPARMIPRRLTSPSRASRSPSADPRLKKRTSSPPSNASPSTGRRQFKRTSTRCHIPKLISPRQSHNRIKI